MKAVNVALVAIAVVGIVLAALVAGMLAADRAAFRTVLCGFEAEPAPAVEDALALDHHPILQEHPALREALDEALRQERGYETAECERAEQGLASLAKAGAPEAEAESSSSGRYVSYQSEMFRVWVSMAVA